jgi:uncharacterized protein
MVIKKLIWDSWNIAHIARHGVIPEEVEQACAGFTIARESYSERFLVVGQTDEGRILAMVLGPEPEDSAFYPVTAHTADRKERRLYLEAKGGEQAA